MKSAVITFILLFSILAPLPPGIAINPETKECGDYFGGDEYGAFIMPPPWEIHYERPIQSKSGTYEVDRGPNSTEKVCNQMGLTYIPGNLGKQYGSYRYSPLHWTMLMVYLCPLLIVIVISSLIIKWAISRKRSRKLPLNN
jgi:hypothetical protein